MKKLPTVKSLLFFFFLFFTLNTNAQFEEDVKLDNNDAQNEQNEKNQDGAENQEKSKKNDDSIIVNILTVGLFCVVIIFAVISITSKNSARNKKRIRL